MPYTEQFKKIHESEYRIPALLPANEKLIREQLDRGKKIRAENMRKSPYRERIASLMKNLFDKNGRVTFDIGRQKTQKEAISTFEKDYELNITYKKERPFVNIKGQKQNLVKLLMKYFKYFNEKKANENILNNLSDKDAKKIVDYLAGEQDRFTSITPQKLSEKTKNLFANKKKYKNVLKLTQFFLKNELYYNTTMREIFNYGFKGKEKEALIHSVGVLTKKIENFNDNISTALDRNQKINKKDEEDLSISQLVVSINPYDVAMMSTQKTWKESCMGVCNGIEKNKEYFPRLSDEIGAFTIIAYGTNNGDLENPVNRVLLKPYFNEEKNSIIWVGKRTFGTGNADLIEILANITEKEINKNVKEDIYTIDSSIYADTYHSFCFDYALRDDVVKKAKNLPIELWKNILKKFPEDEELNLLAIKEYPEFIKHIKNPSEDVKLEAVKRNGLTIEFIKEPSEEIKLEAVKQNGLALQHIKNPSEEIKLEALKQNKLALQYIKNPSEEFQISAVKTNFNSINLIKNPTKLTINEAFKKIKKSFENEKKRTESEQLSLENIARVDNTGNVEIVLQSYPNELFLQKIGIIQNLSNLKYIKNPSKDFLEFAKPYLLRGSFSYPETEPFLLKHYLKDDEEFCMKMVSSDKSLIYLESPSPELLAISKKAILKNKDNLSFFDEKEESIPKEAYENISLDDFWKYLEGSSRGQEFFDLYPNDKELFLPIIKKNPFYILMVKDPDEEFCKVCEENLNIVYNPEIKAHLEEFIKEKREAIQKETKKVKIKDTIVNGELPQIKEAGEFIRIAGDQSSINNTAVIKNCLR